jgi:hypothetical protein
MTNNQRRREEGQLQLTATLRSEERKGGDERQTESEEERVQDGVDESDTSGDDGSVSEFFKGEIKKKGRFG